MQQPAPYPAMQRMRTVPGLSRARFPHSVDRAIDDQLRAAGNELRGIEIDLAVYCYDAPAEPPLGIGSQTPGEIGALRVAQDEPG